jgi:hypothetical protein
MIGNIECGARVGWTVRDEKTGVECNRFGAVMAISGCSVEVIPERGDSVVVLPAAWLFVTGKARRPVVGGEKSKLSEEGWGSFQLMPAADLVKLASGRVSALRVAREEMAARGLGKRAEWVGFEKAGKVWGVK